MLAAIYGTLVCLSPPPDKYLNLWTAYVEGGVFILAAFVMVTAAYYAVVELRYRSSSHDNGGSRLSVPLHSSRCVKYVSSTVTGQPLYRGASRFVVVLVLALAEQRSPGSIVYSADTQVSLSLNPVLITFPCPFAYGTGQAGSHRAAYPSTPGFPRGSDDRIRRRLPGLAGSCSGVGGGQAHFRQHRREWQARRCDHRRHHGCICCHLAPSLVGFILPFMW